MNQAPPRRNANYNGQSRLPPPRTTATTSGPQGVMRTAQRQRPSPLHAPRRCSPDQPPFGPQIPLQIATTHRRRLPPTQIAATHVGPIAPEKNHSTAPRPVTNFLDATFRSYAERIQAELTHLRAACTKVMFRERQDREKWRAHCVTFKEERDAARERVRAMLSERESLRGAEAALNAHNGEGSQQPRAGNPRGAKRGRGAGAGSSGPSEPENAACQRWYSPSSSPSSTIAIQSDLDPLEDEEEAGVYKLLYPAPDSLAFFPPPFAISLSPLSPSFPPLKRSRSAGPVLSTSTMLDDAPYDDREHSASIDMPRRFSEGEALDLKLPPILPPHSEHRSSKPGRPRSSLDTSTPIEVSSTVTSSTQVRRKTRAGNRSPAPVRSSHTEPAPAAVPPSLPLDPEAVHLDIMYVPKDGQLQCRVCLLLKSKSTFPQTAASFPANADWEDLRDHCVREHPRECTDVARLKAGELYELRRRIYSSRS